MFFSKPPDQISLLDVIEACEGGYARDFCVFYPDRRCRGPECEVYCPLREREEGVKTALGRVSLAEMAGALKRHPYSVNRNLSEAKPWKS